ncbi:MAG TPA: hypothetical protein VIL85_01970 [Thermomicrobiales bacterium]
MSAKPAAAKNNAGLLLVLVSVIEGFSFLAGGVLHLGLPLPLGFVTLREPMIAPAAVVEVLAGIGLLLGAGTILAGTEVRWLAVLSAHGFALGGVLLGMAALAAGAGPRTQLNDTYHRIILAVLVIVVSFLLTPTVRMSLGQQRTRS